MTKPDPDASDTTLDLSYRAVIRLSTEHHVDAPGPEKRRFGVAIFRGLAIFSNGDLAHYLYQGTYDFQLASGAIQGVTVWRFDDHSEIHATDNGKLEPTGNEVLFSGHQEIITGTGRFAGATGVGAYKGHRVSGQKRDSNTYWSGTLSVKIP